MTLEHILFWLCYRLDELAEVQFYFFYFISIAAVFPCFPFFYIFSFGMFFFLFFFSCIHCFNTQRNCSYMEACTVCYFFINWISDPGSKSNSKDRGDPNDPCVRLKRDCVGIMAAFKLKDRSHHIVIVANTHLYW